VPQSRQERERLPIAVRGLAVQALSPWPPAMSANHVGLGPGIVDKDETASLTVSPACPSASGLSCADGSIFFEADPLAGEESPDRADPDRNVAIGKLVLSFGQCQIWSSRNQFQKPQSVRMKWRTDAAPGGTA
jgi:hypothetical protein